MKNRFSLTFRLTLLFACTSAAVLLGLGLLIGSLVQMHFEEMDLHALMGKLELAQHTLKKVQSERDLIVLPQQLDALFPVHSELKLLVLDPDRNILFVTGSSDFPQSLLEPKSFDDALGTTQWTARDGRKFRGISALASTDLSGWPPVVVAVGMDLSMHEEFMVSFQKTLWMVVVFAAILSGLLGWIAVRRELAPLRTIRQRAAEITASRLDHRLAEDAVPAEFGELVQTLNAMLARLEDSFQRISEFSADLAHELRTPVTNMSTQTQVILSRPRTAEEYREILYSNAEEFERLSRMISDMLFLAKSDNGLVSPFKETVDLAAEVRDLFSFFEVLADCSNVSLSVEGEGSILGDRMLIRRAINNLLSNAIRHTPNDGRVHVLIKSSEDGDAVLLSIENNGEPLSDVHIPRLFDRFYRADASREGSSEGTGLGLSITKSIIGLHGGTIGALSVNGVTRFEICLPRGQTTA